MKDVIARLEARKDDHFAKARELRVTGRSLKQSADGIRKGTDDYYKALEEIRVNDTQVSRHIGSARAYEKAIEILKQA